MPSTTSQFDHQDWLGTERARTSTSGAVTESFGSLPFGDDFTYNAPEGDFDYYHFAGYDQDNSANEHAQFREYSNMAGRWFSPDPYQGSYNPSNPQSFNRYAYVLNNPLSFTDPLGLEVQCTADGQVTTFSNPPDDFNGGHGTTDPPVGKITWNCEYVGDDGGGGGGGGGGSTGAPNNTSNSPRLIPASYRHKPYYAAFCQSAGGILTQLGCPYACLAIESPNQQITLGVVDLTRSEILPNCPSAGVFCPRSVIIEGTYDPFNGYTNDPTVISCHQ